VTLDILMPFYGRFDHFREAVESVLAQSDRDWRLVIVDDVYPDLAPGQWAGSLGDPRIEYFRNPANLGPGRNFIECVRRMQTEFSVIMGCDDIMLPGYVARIKQLTEQFPDASIYQPGVTVIDAAGDASKPLADRVKDFYRFGGSGARSYSGETLAVSLLRGNWAYFPSLCWRVSALREHGFRDDVNVVQDLAMLLDITMGGGSLVLDDQIVFNYRRHATSVSAAGGPDGSKFIEEEELFARAAEACDALGWQRAAKAARHHYSSRLNALSEFPAALRSGDARARRTILRHVLRRPQTEGAE
jgi:glycosyltransferase involved in cell wall biosynthesis